MGKLKLYYQFKGGYWYERREYNVVGDGLS